MSAPAMAASISALLSWAACCEQRQATGLAAAHARAACPDKYCTEGVPWARWQDGGILPTHVADVGVAACTQPTSQLSTNLQPICWRQGGIRKCLQDAVEVLVMVPAGPPSVVTRSNQQSRCSTWASVLLTHNSTP